MLYLHFIHSFIHIQWQAQSARYKKLYKDSTIKTQKHNSN